MYLLNTYKYQRFIFYSLFENSNRILYNVTSLSFIEFKKNVKGSKRSNYLPKVVVNYTIFEEISHFSYDLINF